MVLHQMIIQDLLRCFLPGPAEKHLQSPMPDTTSSTSTVHPCGDGGLDLWPLLHTFGWILIVFISRFFLATFPFSLANSCKSTGSPIWASNSFFIVVVGVLKVSSPLSARLCFYSMYERQKRENVITETVHLNNAVLFPRITHLRFVRLFGALREKEGDVMGEEKQRDTITISCFYSKGSSEGGAARNRKEPKGAVRSRYEPRGAARSQKEPLGA